MAKGAAKPKTSADREKPARPSVLSNPVERRIAGFWSELLGVSDVRSEDDFFALGGHSLAAVRLFAKIRKQYGVDLPLATLFQAPSLKDLAAVVSARGGRETEDAGPDEDGSAAPHTSNVVELVMPAWSPLVPICAGRPDRLPLFCVHGGGGNVLNLKAISDYLGKDQPFYGLQAQGVDGRLPPLDRIEAMASKYLDGIRSVSPRGPYCLAGYSGGGVIAFEMARQLRAAGYDVPLLVLLDTLSPIAARQPIPFMEKVWNARRWSVRFALGWPERKRNRRLTDARREEARSYVERNELVPHDLLDVHIMDAYLTAQQHYEPSVYEGSAILVKAREAAIDYVRAGPNLGWEDLILGGIEVHNVSGSHFTMMSEPAITEVAAAIRPRLDALHGEAASNIA
jgi:thioesterase domain-containing protein/acyl carrier protein